MSSATRLRVSIDICAFEEFCALVSECVETRIATSSTSTIVLRLCHGLGVCRIALFDFLPGTGGQCCSDTAVMVSERFLRF